MSELIILSSKQAAIRAAAYACATVRVLLMCTTTNKLCCAALRALSCAVLFCDVLFCAVPCHAVLWGTVLQHALPQHLCMNCCQHAEQGKMKPYWLPT